MFSGATAGGLGWGIRRILLPVVMILAWAATWFGGALCLLSEGSRAERTSLWALGCSVASIAMLTWLHMFREAVRQQERDQLFVHMVHRAVPSAAAKELLETRRSAWRSYGFGHAALTVASLILLLITATGQNPFVGSYPILPAGVALLLASLSMPLASLVLRQRGRNEERSEEFLRLYGPGGERTKDGGPSA